MKILLFNIIFVMLTITNSCGQTQNNVSEKQTENMLLEFYSKLFYIYESVPITSAIPSGVRHGKLDSLIKIYCTSKLRNEAKEVMNDGYGHDLLTNDYVGDLNENLRVEKDSTKANWYVVSFTTTNPDAAGKPIKQNVILNLSLVKEGGAYKIDSVIDKSNE